MDAILRSLAEAHAFRKNGRLTPAFYKHLDAVHRTITLLSTQVLFRIPTSIEGPIVERLLGLCEGALDKTEEELNGVLDLNIDEADQMAAESITITESLKEQVMESPAGELTIHPPEAYKCVSLDSHDEKPVAAEDKYGPEPALNTVDAAHWPEIPMSTLSVVYCQILLDLQLLIQKHESFASSSPKQKSNAMFLGALRDLIRQVSTLTLQKLELDKKLGQAGKLTLRDIPANDLATQITLLQMVSFQGIHEREMDQRIPTEEVSRLAPNVHKLQNLSVYLTRWCQYEILRCSDHADRELGLNHLIRVAHHLAELRNWEGCKAIVSGLTTLPIRRLQCSVALNKRLHNKLDSLEQLLSPRRNYAQLRDTLAGGVAPCIPYVGLYLKGFGDGRVSEWQKSIYARLYPEKPIVQHYLLTQPFRTDEELYQLSKLRESNGKEHTDSPGMAEMPDRLTEVEVERLSFAESDRYDRLRLGLQRQQSFISSPLTDDTVSVTTSIR